MGKWVELCRFWRGDGGEIRNRVRDALKRAKICEKQAVFGLEMGVTGFFS